VDSHLGRAGGEVNRLSDADIQAAADLLSALRQGHLTLAGLPPRLTPDNTADVQRIINAVSARIERPIRGWKTYTVYKPMNPPFYAPIYELFPSGAELPVEVSSLRLIEPEVMFRVDHDLPPRETNYTIPEIMESVTAVVGFEVIGSRYRPANASDDPDRDGQGSLFGSFSDHIANGCIVVGASVPGWRDVGFEDVRLRVTEDERELVSVVGCHPFDNPFLPVVVGVNRLRRHVGVKTGHIIVTNSSTSFFAVAAGSVIRAAYDGLGEVAATFTAA
jgi:2-keto-4-pentenoate hydratase